MNTMSSYRTGTWTHAASGASGTFRLTDNPYILFYRGHDLSDPFGGMHESDWEDYGYTVAWDEPQPAQLEKDDATVLNLLEAYYGESSTDPTSTMKSRMKNVIDAVNSLRAKSSVPPTGTDVQNDSKPQPSPSVVHVSLQLTDDDREAFKRLWNKLPHPYKGNNWQKVRDGLNTFLRERLSRLGAVPMVPAPDAEAMAVARLTIKAAKDIGIVRQERDAAIKERDELKRHLEAKPRVALLADDEVTRDAISYAWHCMGNRASNVIKAVNAINAKSAGDELGRLRAEVERLKCGDWTPEEVHGICHKLTEVVAAEAFAEGCAAEQQRIYGCAPDSDKVKAQEKRIAALEAEVERLTKDADTTARGDTAREQQSSAWLATWELCKSLGMPCRSVSGTQEIRDFITGMAERIHALESDNAGKLDTATRCPTCDSPDRKRHPAMQFEGEVQPCGDEWHKPEEPLRLRELIRHCWVHSGFKDCGFDQMDMPMRKLYEEIIGRNPKRDICGTIATKQKRSLAALKSADTPATEPAPLDVEAFAQRWDDACGYREAVNVIADIARAVLKEGK